MTLNATTTTNDDDDDGDNRNNYNTNNVHDVIEQIKHNEINWC